MKKVKSKKKSKVLNNTFVDTIVAQATATGCGGVGIIRVSGSATTSIVKAVIGKIPQPRYADLAKFLDASNSVIDHGLVLFFPGPNSFTGEDVVEFHGHGGAVVLDRLLQRILGLGARLARPGEFSERAFLNGKLDLTQAEAVADLVSASSVQAASSAIKSLQGDFSKLVFAVAAQIMELRTYIEAEIDFTEEEIEFLTSEKISTTINEVLQQITSIKIKAVQGSLLRDGVSVVIAGKPNVGKSSLLNYFCGHDSAIVTDIPGTTRDLLKEYINLDGLPLHIIDTAGIRVSSDVIEQEGVNRAWLAINSADFILLVTDSDDVDLAPYDKLLDKIVIVRNKIDQDAMKPKEDVVDNIKTVYVSVKEQQGLNLLEKEIKQRAGFKTTSEGVFSARRRHLDALQQTEECLEQAITCANNNQPAELLAEELRMAQNYLGVITGEVYTEDLLDRIFSEFCVGK
ncbi:MAG: tRNA uridine-5-carboxymethylaminomethyl(34) synthesis GTPase MnmE [Gammaproteobacteria bacterium]|nr:tRNA uridine-5-carboxymethylaminomethyl(34) synthesis GTPase MnmE [Gammaproteobacteria bacterium]